MNLVAWGALCGLLFAMGILIVLASSPPARPIRLAERLAPYLGDRAGFVPRQAATERSSSPFAALRTLLAAAATETARLVDGAVGGAESVRRRLSGMGRATTVEQFRLEQVAWGSVAGIGAGVATVLAGWSFEAVDPAAVVVAALFGIVGGVLGRDMMLTQQLRRHESTLLAEFPVIADMLSLAVTAGEAPVPALERVARLTSGHLAGQLDMALAAVRSGEPVTTVLSGLAERTTVEPISRFFEGLIVALERGTPLAAVLRAQAADVHEVRKRELLAAGGRREIAMMVPVVFLVLPVTVVFALYPGIAALTSLSP